MQKFVTEIGVFYGVLDLARKMQELNLKGVDVEFYEDDILKCKYFLSSDGKRHNIFWF